MAKDTPPDGTPHAPPPDPWRELIRLLRRHCVREYGDLPTDFRIKLRGHKKRVRLPLPPMREQDWRDLAEGAP